MCGSDPLGLTVELQEVGLADSTLLVLSGCNLASSQDHANICKVAKDLTRQWDNGLAISVQHTPDRQALL